MSALLSSTELAAAARTHPPPPPPKQSSPGNSEPQMPTDAEFLRNFRSELQIGPAAQLAGEIFWCGKNWLIRDAVAAEKNQYLAMRRSRWQAGIDAQRKARAQAEQQQRDDEIFKERAEKWYHCDALESVLGETQALYASGCQLQSDLEKAKAEKIRLSNDASLDIAKLPKLLGAQNDVIEALSTRVSAKATEYKKQLENLNTAAGLATREIFFGRDRVRTPLLALALRAVKGILYLDESTAKNLAEKANAIRALDDVCQLVNLRRSDNPDVLSWATEVHRRCIAVKGYINGPVGKSYEEGLRRACGDAL